MEDKRVTITEHAFARAKERHGIEKKEFQQICKELFRNSSVQSYKKKGRIRARRTSGGAILRIMIGEKGENPRIIPVGVKGDTITTVFPPEEEKNEDFLKYRKCIRDSGKKVFKEFGVYLPFSGYKKILGEVGMVGKSHTVLAILPDGNRVDVIMQVHHDNDQHITRIIRILEIRPNQKSPKGRVVFRFRKKDSN
jgi:hypothetical protein